MLENYLENIIEIYTELFALEEEEGEGEGEGEGGGRGGSKLPTHPMSEREKKNAARISRKQRKEYPRRFSNSFYQTSADVGLSDLEKSVKKREKKRREKEKREEGKRRRRVLPQVVAHSMGGLVALHVLQRRPDLFHSVAFVGCPFEGGVAYIKVRAFSLSFSLST